MCEERKCINCKYMRTRYSEEPCKSCDRMCRSNWVDASTRGTTFNTTVSADKFKNGDIVVKKDDYMSIKNIYIYLCDNWVLRVPNYVVVRSQCDYVTSTYANELITNDRALHIYHGDLDYAGYDDVTNHDCRAKTFYIAETLNEWFGELMKKKPEKASYKVWTVKDPGLGYKNYGTRYDKYPTLNANFIKRVIFSDPATIVFWEDGTKTVVKTQDGEKYDKEKGLAMAIAKRVFGNERDYYHVFKRWMRKGEER